MELFNQLLFTVFFAIFSYFIVAKLVSIATSREIGDVSLPSEGEMGALKSKRMVQIVEQGFRKIDRVSSKNLGLDDEEKIDEHLAGARVIGEKSVLDDGVEENDVSQVCEEKIFEYLEVDEKIVKNDGGDGEGFERLGATGEIIEKLSVNDVAIERRCEEKELEEFDEMFGFCEKKKVEPLTVDDEIVQECGIDGDKFESYRTVIDNIEKIGIEGDSKVNLLGHDHVVDGQVAGMCNEKIVECLNVDDKIVEDLGADGYSFKSSGGIGENTENIGTEADIVVNLGSSDLVGSKMEELVEHLGLNEDISESSEYNDEKVESFGLASDIVVNLETSNSVTNYEMAVGEKSEGKKLEEFEEKIGENLGVENVGSENLGVNVEIVENVGVGGCLKLSGCDNVDEDDDWEGIERSEQEEKFSAAANYVFYGDKNDCDPKLDSDVKMELYGLNKVALEGPCRESQPMMIMVSARAKWNAWQKLGNMSPEVAMEQYVSLLSEKAPQWMENKSSGDGTFTESGSSPPDIGQVGPIKESVVLPNPATLECDLTGGSIYVNKIR